MESSQAMRKAKEMILAVKGKKLSIDERMDKAVQLAGFMLTEAKETETSSEKRIQNQLAKMMKDENGKSFLIQMTDQSFRSQDASRVVNQIKYLVDKYGSPKFLNRFQRFGINTVRYAGKFLPSLFTNLTKYMLRQETAQVILPGESKKLIHHIKKRRSEGVRVNLNRLGEAILGEEEALRRLDTYLKDLERPEIDYVSVKISTICSQLNLLSWEETLETLTDRLSKLYRVAKKNSSLIDGVRRYKFVNLDMEEYRDLHLTVEAFKRVLEMEEFRDFSAGIVLQSYVPDSFLTQQELTVWAMKRVANGGAPIKIRIVKGANLAMEQVESSLKIWPQAPYDKKSDVDANYKRMLMYGTEKEHVKAAHLGIASHNLFDIAYALLICSENEIRQYVCFEMLEGMADHMRRVVQELSGDMLLYCPAATKEEFQNAVAYLVRRLDENTAPGNFLREAFSLNPGSNDWKKQAELFKKSCQHAKEVSFKPRRRQNRFDEPKFVPVETPFQNEPDTDFSLPDNRKWVEKIKEKWFSKQIDQIPLLIGNESILTTKKESKFLFGKGEIYQYSLAEGDEIEKALKTAVLAQEKHSKIPPEERIKWLQLIAQELRIQRGDLIGAMMLDNSKTPFEADVEISEAIDFAEYYLREMKELLKVQEIKWEPKGVVLIASPWNFPCSIPLGGITAALVTGNSVIFKPAKESLLLGHMIANICIKAQVPNDLFQFIMCEDEPYGSLLIKDPRVNSVVLTGATSTAKLFLKMRPGLHLMAETGGKNAIIVTCLADRDLSIKDIIHSAFSFSGQKCSACSLAILEKEVYEDADFLSQLRSAAQSLKVGPASNLSTKINPLIAEPNQSLYQALTTLDEGEEWLLEPKQDPNDPKLWSPGIRLHVKPNSRSHQTEFFGPVLSLMKANDLEHAIQLANSTSYGLTSGLESLDEREQSYWKEHIEAGNLYVNRGITGAVVQRQPFGGCKESSFGPGVKAGGPNYLIDFMKKHEIKQPIFVEPSQSDIVLLGELLDKSEVDNRDLFKSSIGSYSYYYNHFFSKEKDVSLCIGQDNILKYVPRKGMWLRINPDDVLVDILRVIAAAKTVKTDLKISSSKKIKGIDLEFESEDDFIERLKKENIRRVRIMSNPSEKLKQAFSDEAINVIDEPVLAHGRIELLHYLREVAISSDYHRYGNLGDREKEKRTPLMKPDDV